MLIDKTEASRLGASGAPLVVGPPAYITGPVLLAYPMGSGCRDNRQVDTSGAFNGQVTAHWAAETPLPERGLLLGDSVGITIAASTAQGLSTWRRWVWAPALNVAATDPRQWPGPFPFTGTVPWMQLSGGVLHYVCGPYAVAVDFGADVLAAFTETTGSRVYDLTDVNLNAVRPWTTPYPEMATGVSSYRCSSAWVVGNRAYWALGGAGGYALLSKTFGLERSTYQIDRLFPTDAGVVVLGVQGDPAGVDVLTLNTTTHVLSLTRRPTVGDVTTIDITADASVQDAWLTPRFVAASNGAAWERSTLLPVQAPAGGSIDIPHSTEAPVARGGTWSVAEVREGLLVAFWETELSSGVRLLSPNGSVLWTRMWSGGGFVSLTAAPLLPSDPVTVLRVGAGTPVEERR